MLSVGPKERKAGVGGKPLLQLGTAAVLNKNVDGEVLARGAEKRSDGPGNLQIRSLCGPNQDPDQRSLAPRRVQGLECKAGIAQLFFNGR